MKIKIIVLFFIVIVINNNIIGLFDSFNVLFLKILDFYNLFFIDFINYIIKKIK